MEELPVHVGTSCHGQVAASRLRGLSEAICQALLSSSKVHLVLAEENTSNTFRTSNRVTLGQVPRSDGVT